MDHINVIYFSILPYVISIIISPFVGLWVDKFGKNLTLACIGCVLCVLANLSLVISDDDSIFYAWFSVICWGVSISIYYIVSNGTLVSFIVQEEYLGTAYGINFAVQALFETILFLVFGEFFKQMAE